MAQFGTRQQKRRALRPGLEAGGAWLGGMGIFAGLLWLASLMPTRTLAAESPPPLVEAKAAPECSNPGDDVIPFGVGMTRPELLEGSPIVHTPEAREAHVQGLIIARCTVTCRGEVRSCRILKPLPYMEQAALDVLHGRVYKPAQYLGRPITVSYVFALRVAPPTASPP